jgi:hypothetical protein
MSMQRKAGLAIVGDTWRLHEYFGLQYVLPVPSLRLLNNTSMQER